jgi:hypothetical protein
MIFRIFLSILWLVGVSPGIALGGEHSFHDVDMLLPLTNINAMTSQLDHPNPVCSKSFGPIYSPDSIKVLEFGVKAFARNESCADLLSLTPPSWVTASPEAGLFKNSTNWFPVCSLYSLHKIRSNRDFSSVDAGLSQLNVKIKDIQRCVDGEKIDRYEKAYVPPTQQSRGLRPMTQPERAKVVESYREILFETANKCCGKDAECLAIMRNTPLSFCKPANRPDVPDPCMLSGQFSAGQWSDKVKLAEWANTLEGKENIKKEVQGRYLVTSGSIVLSPYVSIRSGEPDFQTSEHFISHELGHACSFAKQELMIRNGSSDAIENFRHRIHHCDISPSAHAVYDHLFTNVTGVTQETYGCLEGWSNRAKLGRFGGKCSHGCPAQHLEEHFADLMMFKVLREKDVIPELIPFSCHARQDAWHGARLDELRCLMQTPWAVKKLEKGLECQK